MVHRQNQGPAETLEHCLPINIDGDNNNVSKSLGPSIGLRELLRRKIQSVNDGDLKGLPNWLFPHTKEATLEQMLKDHNYCNI